PGAIQVTPIRPSVDIRAEAVAARHTRTPASGSPNRLDALLADLDDPKENTAVEDVSPFGHDPISELIHMDPRKREAIVQIKPRTSQQRVPSLDDPDDDEAEQTPLPPPQRYSEEIPAVEAPAGRPSTRDEHA